MKWSCQQCWAVNDAESSVCARCREARPADPVSTAADELSRTPSAPTIPAGAGFGIRLGARLLDLVYLILLGLVLGMVIGVVLGVLAHFGKVSPDWPQRMKQHSWSDYGLSIFAGFLYHAVAEGSGTVSIGKLICGLRVVQTDGSPVNMEGAFIRNLAYYVDALFFGLVGYDAMKKSVLEQRYGDRWAGTVVVKATAFQPQPARETWEMSFGIILGSLAWAGVTVLQIALKVG